MRAGTSGPHGPHAEVHALRAAGERARGGTALVTLEPCDHTGRTGPCSQALIAAGITRVHYAVGDPTAQARGGAATLAAAGVEVESGLLAEEAEAVNEPWLTAMRRGRPFVLWKFAATLDGRSAAADGTSRWITSPESRADVHRLRAEADAVVVGSGTLRADDPHLAVRDREGVTQPLRVVVDPGATIKSGARVLDDAAPTLLAVAEDASTAHLPRRPGVETVRLPRADGGLAIPALLAALHERGVRSVLLEGGPTLMRRVPRRGRRRQGRRLSRSRPARRGPRRPRRRRNHHHRAGVAPRDGRRHPARSRSARHRRSRRPRPLAEEN